MVTISLKALVDKDSNKVIFIECDGDFVDVLFSYLTIPLGTIHLQSRVYPVSDRMGCVDNLCGSVHDIDKKDFRSFECPDMLLYPRYAAESLCNKLKLKVDDGNTATSYFMCSSKKCLSYYPNITCPCSSSFIAPSSKSTLSVDASEFGGVFVKKGAKFMVTDDLQVMPLSAASISLFAKLGVTDASTTEELTFNIGYSQVVNLLIMSLISRAPFSEILLKHKPVPIVWSNKFFYQAIKSESQLSGDTMNDEDGNISIKLVVSKSKKIVCYAEAGEDFANFLFSFISVPLGFIVKTMKNGSLQGCIGHLYKTAQYLDGQQYMKSNYHKDLLLNPKLVPGFCYKNSLLGIEEVSYCYVGSKSLLTTNKSLICNSSSELVKLKVVDPKSHRDRDESARGFLKGPAVFVVTDHLVVRSKSPIFELSVLKDLNVPITDIETRIVHVGKKEEYRWRSKARTVRRAWSYKKKRMLLLLAITLKVSFSIKMYFESVVMDLSLL